MWYIWPINFFTRHANALAKLVKIGSILASVIVYCVMSYLGFWKDMIAGLLTRMNTLNPSNIGQPEFAIIDGISYINAIIPLSEIVGLYVIYFNAWMIVIAFRWGKSFVPTVAN